MVIWETAPQDGVREIYASQNPHGLQTVEFSPPLPVASSYLGAIGTLPAIPGGVNAVGANVAWDRSGGANHGRIYIVYADVAARHCEIDFEPLPEGTDYNHTNICMTSSNDGGSSWDIPRVVNEESAAGSTVSRFFPSVAVNPLQGVIAVGWYDTSGDPINGVQTRFRIAASNDGGNTFGSSVSASLGSSDATEAGLHSFGAAPNNGDYASLNFSVGSGSLNAAWTDNSPTLLLNPDRPQFEISFAAIGIMNVRPSRAAIRPLPIFGIEGTPIHAPVATFTHPDASRMASDFTALIDWGDDSITPGTISGSGSLFTVAGSHTYANEGRISFGSPCTTASRMLTASR